MARKKDDLASVLAAFKRMPKAVRMATNAAIDKGADELVDRMRYLAPVADEQGGELRDSIRKEAADRPLAVTVVAGGVPATTRQTPSGPFDYSLAVEYGTRDTPAQPFFWVSTRMLGKRVRGRIDRAIAKAVKAEWSKQ